MNHSVTFSLGRPIHLFLNQSNPEKGGVAPSAVVADATGLSVASAIHSKTEAPVPPARLNAKVTPVCL